MDRQKYADRSYCAACSSCLGLAHVVDTVFKCQDCHTEYSVSKFGKVFAISKVNKNIVNNGNGTITVRCDTFEPNGKHYSSIFMIIPEKTNDLEFDATIKKNRTKKGLIYIGMNRDNLPFLIPAKRLR